jgi:hypothetical protein
MDEGPFTASQFPHKSQILEIHKREKHFKVSHKVEVLTRIYFSIMGLSIDRWVGGERNISYSPCRKWEQRLQMVAPMS